MSTRPGDMCNQCHKPCTSCFCPAVFSEDDLKRLKEDIGNGTWLQSLSGQHLTSLLARLECAEKVCVILAGQFSPEELEEHPELEAWRKAKGDAR